MGKRKCIGLIYSYNENWIGGTYYIENIIAALNGLSDNQRPLLKVYTTSREEFNQLRKKVPYRYIKYISIKENYNLAERIVNVISRILFKKNVIDKKSHNGDFSYIFPNPSHYFFDSVCQEKKIYWIPDFQEDYLPQFFSQEEILTRKKEQQKLAQNACNIVFSSNDACNDFIRLYPESKTRKIVLPFAVRPFFNKQDDVSDEILKKYDIPGTFILIPNQLWIHKNHLTVIRAAKILAEQGIEFLFIFTGKDSDYRFHDYPQELYHKVISLGLTEYVKFLGFIPKDDLAILMQKCIAIIQPSLFEGWSTVIEEAKSMSKYVIASDLPIHIEQLNNYPNKVFFSKEDPQHLAKTIFDNAIHMNNITDYDYQKDFENFGHAILTII